MKIKQSILFISLLLIVSNSCLSQKIKEFEGKISYTHLVTKIDSLYNVQDDYNYMGTTSEFFYKEGKYKWVNNKAYIEMEVFNNLKANSYLKFSENDTILRLKSDELNETVIDYTIIKNGDKILGHTCDVLVIKAGSNGNTWERRYSFANEYKINPASFNNYKFNSTDIIYSRINALPLKIELIFKNRKVSYIATKVEKIPVSNNIFDFPVETKFKDGM
ncbi:MAG: hypothetical protein V4572_09745 [Bacteroidota bacterium]